MKDRELKVSKIKNGTVLDHLPTNKALEILKILNLSDDNSVIIAMNLKSKKYHKKDIIKIENKFLTPEETNKLALLAPKATINIIKNYSVTSKRYVKLPAVLDSIAICPNKKCITNIENCKTKFLREKNKYRCYFCEKLFSIHELVIK